MAREALMTNYPLPPLIELDQPPQTPLELHRAAVQEILTHPKNHNQGSYTDASFCGTTCCYVGFVLLLSGKYRLDEDYGYLTDLLGEPVQPGDEAAELLDLQYWECWCGYDLDGQYHSGKDSMFSASNNKRQTLCNAERYARKSGGTVLDLIEAVDPDTAVWIREQLVV